MDTQLNLLEDVLNAYADTQQLSNDTLYQKLGCVPNRREIGVHGAMHDVNKRKVRWYQQTLKQLGLLKKVDGKRGVWTLTKRGKQRLSKINVGYRVYGFSTRLGLAVWGECKDVFSRIDEPIHLTVTSPPYPLKNQRAYGNVQEAEYVDFICGCLEPIVERLCDGGSIALNVSNDIFLTKSPARSLYRERLVLALHDRLGLFKMDELIWYNKCKPPAPIQWASKTRYQLHVKYEPVYWFTNNPLACRSSNQRVLQPHTEQHKKFVAKGGQQKETVASDGAYRKKVGAYAKPTKGRIPSNVMEFPHNCPSQSAYKKMAKGAGLPAHGAPFPLALAKFLISFLSREGDLIADPFAGSFTTAVAAEELGRRWLATDTVREYVQGGALRFG